MDAQGTSVGVVAVGRWTVAEGPARADRMPWPSRQTAGPLARMAAHALDALWCSGEPPRPLPVVLATANGDPTAAQPWSELERQVAQVEGVARVTTITAAYQTVAAALWWAALEPSVVVVWADLAPTAELAVAMWLAPDGGLARIGWPFRQAHAAPRRPSPNPCIGASRLADALVRGGTVRLDADVGAPDPGMAWCSVVQPGAAPPSRQSERGDA